MFKRTALIWNFSKYWKQSKYLDCHFWSI